MQYREGCGGDKISLLGYGCMRFSRKGAAIDIDKAEEELMRAINAGVNYLDTAWMYPGSEEAVGEILQKNNARDRVYIATKLPQYIVRKESDFDKYFDEELRRLKTDYVDYYLMHMLSDTSRLQRLRDLGLDEWVAKQKEAGRIRHIGFSFHGNSDTFIELLHAFPWDFTQIQYNYLDVHSQGGVRGLREAASMNVPVVIMEPLRGGKLAVNLPEGAMKAFEQSGHDWSPAQWGLRWLFTQPEVSCVLSGMNSVAMLEENLSAADESRPGDFGEAEYAVIEQAKEVILAATKVNCTSCRYCMPCPAKVDIPSVFAAYNAYATDGKMDGIKTYLQNVGMKAEKGYARQCTGCGKCEKHCPQALPIRDLLKEAESVLSPWYVRPVQKIVGSMYK